MKYETIDYEQIKDIMEGREPRPPEGWDELGRRPVGEARPAVGTTVRKSARARSAVRSASTNDY